MKRWMLAGFVIFCIYCLAYAVGCSRGQTLDPAPVQAEAVQGNVMRDASGAPSGIRVTWPRSEESSVIGYRLYRDNKPIPDSARGDWSYWVTSGSGNPIILQPAEGDVVFDDLFSPIIGTSYYYRVSALDGSYGESLLSPEGAVPITLFSITAIQIPSAAVGDTTTIIGERFGVFDVAYDAVSFPGVSWQDGVGFIAAGYYGTITDWQQTSIDVTVPMGTTTGNLTVTVGSNSASSPDTFTNSDPYITDLSALTAQVGSQVTLTGNNFGDAFDRNTHYVVLNDTPLTADADYVSYANTAITFNVAGGGFGDSPFTVRVNGVDSNMGFVTITPPPGSLWEHTWGAGEADIAVAVTADADGNVYLAGNTASADFSAEPLDVMLVKYDPDGLFQWMRAWGNEDNATGLQDEAAVDICVDGTSQVLMTGNIQAADGTMSVLYMAYGLDGAWGFTRKWVATGPAPCWGNAITCDGSNVYIAGTITNADDDLLLLKYDTTGGFDSAATIPLTNNQEPHDIIVDSNGDLIIVGTAENAVDAASGNDVFVIKATSDLTMLWTRYWGGALQDDALSVTIDGSNNVIVAGGSSSFDVTYQPFIIVYSSDGTLGAENVWPLTQNGYFTSIDIAPNGDFLCSGSRKPNRKEMLYAQFQPDYSTAVFQAYTGISEQPAGMSGFMDNAGDMFLCGDAISLGATWGDIVIEHQAIAGLTATDETGTSLAVGASSANTGVSTDGASDGTEDAGGGWNDMLIVKYRPET